MLQKYLLVFALGGVVVGGIVYFTRRPVAVPAQPPAVAATVQQQPALHAQTEAPAVQEPATPAHIQSSKPDAPQPSAAKPAKSVPQSQDSLAQVEPPATARAAASPQAVEPPQAPPPPVAVRHEERQSNIMRPDPVAEPKNRTPQTVTIPSGTVLAVRLRQLISTDRQAVGDAFAATLDQPIVIDGFVIADKGSNVRGKITSLEAPGRVKGRASISLELSEINTTDGQRVDIHTDTYRNEAASGAKGDAVKVGAGAVLATKGEDVRLTSETRLTFRLTENVTLTEKLN